MTDNRQDSRQQITGKSTGIRGPAGQQTAENCKTAVSREQANSRELADSREQADSRELAK